MCSTGAGDPLGSLEAAVDALLAADPAAVAGDGEALDRVRALVRLQNKVTAALTAAVRVADTRQASEHDGLTTLPAWLRGHARLSRATASRLVRHGRALQHLPAAATAYAAGQLSDDAVDVLARLAEPANLDKAADQGIDLTEVESTLLGVATARPHRDLQVAVGHYLAALDPDGPEPDPTEGRSLGLVQHRDGSWTFGGALDTVGGEKLATAVESIAAASRCAGDTRSRAQRLADSLVQLADLALASGQLPVLRGQKPHVVVTIGIDDLVDPATGATAATTGLGATLSAARARWLACDSQVSRIVIGPDGVPLDHGRTKRLVTPAQRRSLELRDRGCVFAGCEAPTWWCDAHHLLDWIFDGPTDVDNLGLLCETAPHQGPPRLPRRTRRHRPTRPPMAHLASRRHRDPPRRTASRVRRAPGLPDRHVRPRSAPSTLLRRRLAATREPPDARWSVSGRASRNA
ncbi:HNH endonuclease [Geodermatophilus sp. YIM 151500]|uniref:HNH endonuclease signature motif containing protein n=1 Tax=Geodermatophilus sp. YIM 151500 TaxID=2984531 RepID=UPI0021E43FD9|nr:HNH endonuclease signature motif containing protein [Geodermatophilus sp. YIM 151500]MCV2490125.1 HNH endonuclease [Geodermatophilus sp. YIM 151500]